MMRGEMVVWASFGVKSSKGSTEMDGTVGRTISGTTMTGGAGATGSCMVGGAAGGPDDAAPFGRGAGDCGRTP
jgi:hypothetical protein